MKKDEFGLTVLELRILDILGVAWNEYAKLEPVHRSDIVEFQQALHQAQTIVLARPAMRYLAKINKKTE